MPPNRVIHQDRLTLGEAVMLLGAVVFLICVLTVAAVTMSVRELWAWMRS